MRCPTCSASSKRPPRPPSSCRSRPDNDTLLELYALYKQATSGDASGNRPGGFDFVGAAKYDAWTRLKGTTAEAPMREYIALVNRLKG